MLNCFKHLWVYILVQMYRNQTRKGIYNFLSQNVLIPCNRKLPTQFYKSSINIGYIFYHLLTSINPTICYDTTLKRLIFHFLSSLRFSNLICLIKKMSWLDWKWKQFVFLTREKIKAICLTKEHSNNVCWFVKC